MKMSFDLKKEIEKMSSDNKEAFAQILPILQNAMQKAKGFSREELIASGMFEKIVAESLEDLGPICDNVDNATQISELTPEKVQEMMNDPEQMEEVQEMMNKIISLK